MIEGKGFIAATARSVAAGLALLARDPSPTKVFDWIEDAAHWIAPLLAPDADEPLDAKELAADVARARSDFRDE